METNQQTQTTNASKENTVRKTPSLDCDTGVARTTDEVLLSLLEDTLDRYDEYLGESTQNIQGFEKLWEMVSQNHEAVQSRVESLHCLVSCAGESLVLNGRNLEAVSQCDTAARNAKESAKSAVAIAQGNLTAPLPGMVITSDAIVDFLQQSIAAVMERQTMLEHQLHSFRMSSEFADNPEASAKMNVLIEQLENHPLTTHLQEKEQHPHEAALSTQLKTLSLIAHYRRLADWIQADATDR